MTPYFDQLTVHVDGAEATFDFVGDLFELQDHRNWADANWKTYGTPLAFGFPVTLPRGETLTSLFGFPSPEMEQACAKGSALRAG